MYSIWVKVIKCCISLYSAVGLLTQGGGVFGTFVSSFYLQFSQDGREWYTYKELVADARPRAKVTSSPYDFPWYAVYIEGHLPLLFQIVKLIHYHSPSRFFMVTMMIEGCQRPGWTGWCWVSLSACCHSTSRMASTFDLRSWAVEMVSLISLMLLCWRYMILCTNVIQMFSSPLLQVTNGWLPPFLPPRSPQ